MTSLTKPSLIADVPGIFSDFWDDDFWSSRFSNQQKMPLANVKESDEDFSIELAVPGMTKKDFDISVDNNILKITSEKKMEKEEKEENYTRREFSYSSFARSFSLPENINADKIKATYEDGILKLKLPKRDPAKKQNKRLISVG